MSKKPEFKSMRSPSAVLIRSQLELGGYCDYEENHEPSMTNPSLDEPIEALVARLLRGEQVSSGVPPVYDDIAPGTDVQEVFNGQSVAERDGFDLSDIPVVMAAGEVAAASVAKLNTPPTPESVKPQEAPVAASEAKA